MQKQKIEVHLTANINNKNSFNQFKKVCMQLNAKALEIVLSRGNHIRQIMLSKEIVENKLELVHQEVQCWIDIFEQNQIPIIRKKIETPFFKDEIYDFQTYYYEWHGLVEYHHISELKRLCETHQVHLSYNALKGCEKYRFLTLREYGDASLFLERLDKLKAELHKQNRILMKERTENCIYDTNIALDQGWLSI